VLRSVTANTRQDGLDLLREAAAIPVRTHTRRFPLEEANQALHALKAGMIKGAAVLVMNSHDNMDRQPVPLTPHPSVTDEGDRLS